MIPARPVGVSLSYLEADRWLCAEGKVENVPLQDDLREWLRVFTNEHYRVEQPRRQRAQSFLSPEERERAEREPRQRHHREHERAALHHRDSAACGGAP